MANCPVCDDTGFKYIERTERGRTVKRATRCDCQLEQDSARLLDAARIPLRYFDCDFAHYYPPDAPSGSLAKAKQTAEAFAENYPDVRGGLLIVGDIGVGKTHLAVAILKQLIRKRVRCLFSDYRELLKQIQNSYNPTVQETESDILRPVFNSEVLVLDELGAVRPSEWVWDTVSLILNSRYNNRLTTIITTNYPDLAAAGASDGNDPQAKAAKRAARPESLGDRIGERMRSRLHEMCEVIEMRGEDHRNKRQRSVGSLNSMRKG
jgi:DNA replication protein DnaC